MTDEQIAKHLGWHLTTLSGRDSFDTRLRTLVAKAEAEERERCAKICDQADKSTHPSALADLIRGMK